MIFPSKPVRTIKRNVRPADIATTYLIHEFLKIFWDVRDLKFRHKLIRSLQRFRQRDGDHTYWLLVAAIAEGWRVKNVYHYLTNPGFNWNLEERKITDLTMTGFNPPVVDRVIFQCKRDFVKFANYYRAHRPFFSKYMPNLKPQPYRDRHPIFVLWDAPRRQLRVFDGMRRTTLAAIANKKTIRAYVGYPVRAGKPMVNLDKIHYLLRLWGEAKQDNKTREAFIRVCREIVQRTSNGRRRFRLSMKPWSNNQERKFIRAVTK